MRTGHFVLLITLACTSAAFGQSFRMAPVPADPLELVTGQTQIPATAAQRAEIVSLMERTVGNHNLHLRGGAPFALNMSLNLAASTLYPAASGTMQETWATEDNWRWSTAIGNYSQVALSSNGAIYNQNPAPLPMRVREIRHAIFAPVLAAPRRATIRTANAFYQGTSVTCILLSAGANEQTPAIGRQWYETEFCIDPSTATLRIFSEAPGIYVAYDYSGMLKFHNRTLPTQVSISRGGAVVAEARITSIVDTDPSNLSVFTPTAQMIAQGPGSIMASPERFPMIVYSETVPPTQPVQPVIVHVTLDAQGSVLEVEALQTGALTEQAIALIQNRKYGAVPQPSGASAVLRDAYVNVQFRPVSADRAALLH